MKLYLLRHGDAVESGDPRYKENERPLTPKGSQRTKQLAHALREMGIAFDRILSSPLARAKQTAEIMARGMDKPVELTDALTPSGSMKALMDQVAMLRPVPASVLLVGHEPFLGGFLSLLCVGGPDLPLKLKKGALVRVEVDRILCGKCATLEWLVPPRLVGLKSSRRKED